MGSTMHLILQDKDKDKDKKKKKNQTCTKAYILQILIKSTSLIKSFKTAKTKRAKYLVAL